MAALIRPSSRNADPSQSASPPCARSVGIHRGSFALRYLAHGKSIISHTWTSSSRDCYEYRFGRSAGAGGLPRPASESLVSRCSCRSSTRSTSRRGCVPILLRCPHVLVPEPQSDLLLRCHADPAFHKTSQTGPVPFALIPDEAPLRITRSKNVRHVASHGSRHTKSIITITRRGYIDGRNGDFVKIPVILNMST